MFLLLLAIVAGGESDAADFTRRLTENSKQTTGVLRTVIDRASAEKAKPRLEELHARYERYRKDLADRPDAERDELPRRLVDEQKKQDEALTLAHDRVFVKHKDAYKLLTGTGVFNRVETALEGKAERLARQLEQACRTYHINNDARWPSSLLDLVEKPGGRPALLDGGVKAITDPWGAPFQYRIPKQSIAAGPVPVWTLSPHGSGAKVIGHKPTQKEK